MFFQIYKIRGQKLDLIAYSSLGKKIVYNMRTSYSYMYECNYCLEKLTVLKPHLITLTDKDG